MSLVATRKIHYTFAYVCPNFELHPDAHNRFPMIVTRRIHKAALREHLLEPGE